MLESKSLAATLSVAALALGLATPALADPSPNGPGQPGVLLLPDGTTGGTACGDFNATSSPTGFNGSGFTDATLVYAGSSGTPSLNGDQQHAISQYDIACFQQTQQGH